MVERKDKADMEKKLIGYRVEYRPQEGGDWKVLTRAAGTKEGEKYARERAAEIVDKAEGTWVRLLRVEEVTTAVVEWNAPAPSGGGASGVGKGGACGWG